MAFYGSTPVYWPVLELHDRAELGTRLHDMSKQGAWDRMAELIDDDLVDAVAVSVTDPRTGAVELRRRFDGVVDRLGFTTPYRADPAALRGLLTELT